MNRRVEIDVRGLEPPLPMVRILEACATLPSDGELLAFTDRLPVFLLAELPRRGLAGESQLAPDGDSYITHIHHVQVPAPPAA